VCCNWCLSNSITACTIALAHHISVVNFWHKSGSAITSFAFFCLLFDPDMCLFPCQAKIAYHWLVHTTSVRWFLCPILSALSVRWCSVLHSAHYGLLRQLAVIFMLYCWLVYKQLEYTNHSAFTLLCCISYYYLGHIQCFTFENSRRAENRIRRDI